MASDGQEARPTVRSMTDEELLELIVAGIIVIEHPYDAYPQLIVNGRRVKAILNEQGGRRRIYGGKRYRWKIQHKGRCRRIVCSRLVWMFVEVKIIPPKHVLHHGPLGSKVDSYFNIELMSYADHQEHHYGNPDSF